MENKKDKLWSRFFILACIAGLCSSACMQMLNANLTPFAADCWGSRTLGGYLTTFFNIGSIAMAFFTGRIVDINGRRRCYIIGGISFGLVTLIPVFFPIPSVCMVVRVLQGICKSICTISAASIVSDVVPQGRMGEGIGLYGLGQTLATAFGPMLALAVTANGDYTPMWLLCAILYALAGFVGFGITYESKPEYADKIENRRAMLEESRKTNSQYKGIWKLIEKQALLPSISYTVFFFVYACVLVFITVYAKEILGFSATKISTFYTATAVSMLAIRFVTGKISDRFGALYTVIPGHVCIIAMLVLLVTSAKHYGIFLLCGALYGAGQCFTMPALSSVAVVDSPESRGGTANSTFYFFQDFGILFSSAIFGKVIDNAATPIEGYRTTFLVSASVGVLSLLVCIFLYNNRTRNRRRTRYGLKPIDFSVPFRK